MPFQISSLCGDETGVVGLTNLMKTLGLNPFDHFEGYHLFYLAARLSKRFKADYRIAGDEETVDKHLRRMTPRLFYCSPVFLKNEFDRIADDEFLHAMRGIDLRWIMCDPRAQKDAANRRLQLLTRTTKRCLETLDLTYSTLLPKWQYDLVTQQQFALIVASQWNLHLVQEEILRTGKVPAYTTVEILNRAADDEIHWTMVMSKFLGIYHILQAKMANRRD